MQPEIKLLRITDATAKHGRVCCEDGCIKNTNTKNYSLPSVNFSFKSGSAYNKSAITLVAHSRLHTVHLEVKNNFNQSDHHRWPRKGIKKTGLKK